MALEIALGIAFGFLLILVLRAFFRALPTLLLFVIPLAGFAAVGYFVWQLPSSWVIAIASIVLAMVLATVISAIRDAKRNEIKEVRKPEWGHVTRLAHRWYRGQQFFTFGKWQAIEDATEASARYDKLVARRRTRIEQINEIFDPMMLTKTQVKAWFRFSKLSPRTHLRMFTKDYPEIDGDPAYRRWALEEFKGLRAVWDRPPNNSAEKFWRSMEAQRASQDARTREELDRERSKERAQELKRSASMGRATIR